MAFKAILAPGGSLRSAGLANGVGGVLEEIDSVRNLIKIFNQTRKSRDMGMFTHLKIYETNENRLTYLCCV